MSLVEKQLVGGQPAVEKRLAWAVENFRFRAAQAVARLRTGKTTLAEFSEWGYKNIKDHLYMVAEIGKGERLTRKEIYAVRRTLKPQVKFWDNFAQSIANQRQTLKGLEGAELEEAEDKLYAKFGKRAQSYYGAIQAEGRQWYFDSRFPDGTWFRWDMDPLLENCETCIGRDKKVYQKKDGRLPFMPKDGTTICLYNCGCSWAQLLKPPSGRRRKLGPMGTRRRGKKLRQKSEEDMFDWGAAALCGICGRVLTDPESVARGIGPVCWAEKGGKGSGHRGHAGRPGLVGGSLPSDLSMHSYLQALRAKNAPVQAAINDAISRNKPDYSNTDREMLLDVMAMDRERFMRYAGKIGLDNAEELADDFFKEQKGLDQVEARARVRMEDKFTAKHPATGGVEFMTSMGDELWKKADQLVGMDGMEVRQRLLEEYGVKVDFQRETDRGEVWRQMGWLLNMAEADPRLEYVIREHLSKVTYAKRLPGDTAAMKASYDHVYILPTEWPQNPSTMVHELGHVFEKAFAQKEMTAAGFDQGQRASSYAWRLGEDFAEVFRAVIGNQKHIQKFTPQKYAAIEAKLAEAVGE